MKRFLSLSVLSHPVGIAFVIAVLFSVRFLDCLPFSGSTRVFNSETAITLTSFLMYAQEPFSFPLGSIKALTFPFEDANVGNVGAIPLFAVSIKAVGQLFPYFLTFDYFILIEILSVLLTAYFSQRILAILGVQHLAFRALGALLTGTAFILLIRSAWPQPFCVVEFPLFMTWIYAMVLTLRRGSWKFRQDLVLICLFPLAALVDNYALWGIILGMGALLARELFEAFFGNLSSSWNRVYRLSFLLFGGVALSVLALYVIGMFPLPPIANTFTSYDFGMGGRHHVADLFAPWIPPATKYFPEPSLLGRLGFPVNTDHLGEGQYEGVAYVGTSILILWFCIAVTWLWSLRKRLSGNSLPKKPTPDKIALYPPWRKVGLAVLFVFIFSLGYELHIFGAAFPDFSGMPAAWIADRLPSVYNIRATGRLASLLSIFLILEGVRVLYVWHRQRISGASPDHRVRFPYLGVSVVAVLAIVHLFEIVPLLRPVPAQPLHPIGGTFNEQELVALRRLAASHDVALIAPSVRAADAKWTTEAFSLAYYLDLRSNLFIVARTQPDHDLLITRDLGRIMNGDWDSLLNEYGRALIAIPSAHAEKLRARMRGRYQETRVGTISLWSKRDSQR